MIVARRTLRGRVSLLALAVLAAWLVVLTVALNLVVRSTLDRQLDDRLRVLAQASVATVDIRDGTIVGHHDSADDRGLDATVWIYDTDHAIIRPAAGAAVQALADRLASSNGAASRAGYDDTRLLASPVTDDGHRIGTVVTAVNTESVERADVVTLIGSSAAAVLLLLGAYPVMRFAAGRAVRPLDEMSRSAARWSVSDPSRRFGAGQRFVELDRLARNLDGLLDRMSGLLRHERSMSAELSHELRTPLSHVVAEADLLLHGSGLTDDAREAVDGIAASAARMETIIATLLATSRADSGSVQGRCDVRALLETASKDAVQSGARVETHIEVEGDVHAGIDARVAERIVAPVLENAARYARSRIELHAGHDRSRVAIDIGNDGPAIDAGDEEQIFQPGFRGDVPAGHDGAGLGLPLARRLARAADGDVRVVRLDPPVFRITLPSG